MDQVRDKSRIMLYDKENFMEWKEYIINLVESKDLEHVLTGEDVIEPSNEGSSTLSTKTSKAKVLKIIRQHLDILLHYLIHGIKDPKEAMKVIENYCIGNRAEMLLLLEDKLNKPDGRYFLEKLTDFNKSYRNFKMLNGELNEQKVIHKMFLFAPKTMDILLLKKELELSARFEPNKKPSYHEVFGKMHQLAMKAQDEYKRRINSNGRSLSIICFKCNKPGHRKINCQNAWYCTICKTEGHSSYTCKRQNTTENTKYQKQNEKEDFANAFMGIAWWKEDTDKILKLESSIYHSNTLVLDSGASYHVCGKNYLCHMKEVRELKEIKKVNAAGGKTYISKKSGTFDAFLENGQRIILKDVVIFDELNLFLVSMATLMSKGICLNAKEDTISIYKNENLLYAAKRNMNNLFLLKCKAKEDNKVTSYDQVLKESTVQPIVALFKDTLSQTEYDHNVFGHQGMESFKNTLNYFKLEVDMNKLKEFSCRICELTKMKKGNISRKNKVGFISGPGQFFVIDSVEVLTTSRAGNVGFVLITDINSKYRFLYCYKKKSEIADQIVKFLRWFQRQTNIMIKKIHSDQGKEIFNVTTKKYCQDHGIEFTVSAPYVPEHNGIAERSNQFVLTRMRSMINSSVLNGKLYWDFAAFYTIYISNRVTEGKNTTSAYETVFNRKSKLEKMHIFGSLVVYLVEADSQIECKGKEGFFAGYNYITGEALIIDKDKRNLVKTRNFKISKRSKTEKEQKRLDKNIYTENISPYCPESGVVNEKDISKTKENDKTIEENKSQKDKETGTLLPAEQFVRRSSRKVQPPERLTYAQVVNNDTKYIFEDAAFLFMQPNLIDFAAALVVRDNTIPKSYFQIKNKPQSEKWFQDYDKELNKLINVGKMKLKKKSEVKENNVIPIMELYSKKTDNISKEEIFKCRFVARGDLQDEFLKYYSPTAKMEFIRLFIFVVASKNWKWIQVDIGNAFLNATLDRLYYYVLPQKLRRMYPNYVWESKQALYGLKESPLYWCKEIGNTLKKLDFEVNLKENTIFIHRKRSILILLHVDDMLFASDEEFQLTWILNKLKEVYDVKNTTEVKNYVGFEILENTQSVFLTAEKYIIKLAETFEVKKDERNVIPHIVNFYIDKPDDSRRLEFIRKYQSIVGSLTYIARVCRPDIAFQTNMLAQCASTPTIKHLNAAKKVIGYLLNTKKHGLKYSKGETRINIEGFCDASHASLNKRCSVTGFIVKVNNAVLLYKTKKQKKVATSSTEAEIVACATLIKELKWLKINLQFMNLKLNEVNIRCDNQGTCNKMGVRESYSGIKQLEIEHYFSKQTLEDEKWNIQYISSKENDADVLTKPVARNIFLRNCKKWLVNVEEEKKKKEM
eukprot:snap_masked-scaffold_39-processed-gene-2.63-mRNA-1 protein AED:0.47 eAED:0.47 QI:0/-1/0/1/-1/1/1/0/1363